MSGANLKQSSVQATDQALVDQAHFVLDPEQWERFCNALDAQPREIPELQRLLSKNVFDAE